MIDEHRGMFGVEPICRVLQVAPSSGLGRAARYGGRRVAGLRPWRQSGGCSCSSRLRRCGLWRSGGSRRRTLRRLAGRGCWRVVSCGLLLLPGGVRWRGLGLMVVEAVDAVLCGRVAFFGEPKEGDGEIPGQGVDV